MCVVLLFNTTGSYSCHPVVISWLTDWRILGFWSTYYQCFMCWKSRRSDFSFLMVKSSFDNYLINTAWKHLCLQMYMLSVFVKYSLLHTLMQVWLSLQINFSKIQNSWLLAMAEQYTFCCRLPHLDDLIKSRYCLVADCPSPPHPPSFHLFSFLILMISSNPGAA